MLHYRRGRGIGIGIGALTDGGVRSKGDATRGDDIVEANVGRCSNCDPMTAPGTVAPTLEGQLLNEKKNS